MGGGDSHELQCELVPPEGAIHLDYNESGCLEVLGRRGARHLDFVNNSGGDDDDDNVIFQECRSLKL